MGKGYYWITVRKNTPFWTGSKTHLIPIIIPWDDVVSHFLDSHRVQFGII